MKVAESTCIHVFMFADHAMNLRVHDVHGTASLFGLSDRSFDDIGKMFINESFKAVLRDITMQTNGRFSVDLPMAESQDR